MKMKVKMRQLFGIILSLVLALGLMPGISMTAYAASETTVVYDLSVDGKTINKDGVTCTEGFDSYNNHFGGTFTTSNGKFTKIVVNANDVSMTGMNRRDYSSIEGWSSNHSSATWTGNSASVQFGNIMGNSGNVTITFTIEPSVDVTGVSLNKKTSTLTVGDMETLAATVSPEDATDKSVTWSSDNTSVATVDANGKVTAVAKGTANITATATNGTDATSDDKTARCAVTVVSAPVPISYAVTFKVANGSWNDGSTADKSVTLAGNEGDTLKLSADQIPDVGTKPNANYKEGSWDITPTPGTAITGNVTYTYTYVRDISGESSDNGSTDNTNTTTDTSAKVPYDSVPISTGSVTDITGTAAATAESNPFGTKIENNSNLTTLLSLTDAEVAQGVNVWLDVQDMSSSVSKSDKSKIEKKSGDYTVGLYLDINLFKKVGNNDATKVSETNGKIKASIVIPKKLRKSGRTFEIIRVHNGKAATITGKYTKKTHVFTFETDKFSTYAIAYKDASSSTDTESTDSSSSATTTSTTTTTTTASTGSTATTATAPKTGDANDMRVWYLLLIASLGGLGFLGLSKKKEN